MDFITLNLSMGTSRDTLNLVKACLSLLESCLEKPKLSKISQMVNTVSLPWELRRRTVKASETLSEEFERCGGLDALEQLQYCENE